MSEWSKYYENRLGSGYTRYCESRYSPFVNELLIKKEGFIREEGCGIGTISKILHQRGYKNLFMMDRDLEMIQLARLNTSQSIPVIQADIRDIRGGGLDLIHSHGVLEHFGLADIKQILDRQRSQAKRVVHYVPTDGYKEPSFGDERLESIEWWQENTRPDKKIVFNQGKDLVLIWDKEVDWDSYWHHIAEDEFYKNFVFK